MIAVMPKNQIWMRLFVAAGALVLASCAGDREGVNQSVASNRLESERFVIANGMEGPSKAVLKRCGLGETFDHFVFVDGIVDLKNADVSVAAELASSKPPVEYTTHFDRITAAYHLSGRSDIAVFEHPIEWKRPYPQERREAQRITTTGGASISGSGAMTVWEGEKLLGYNETLASWIVLKPKGSQVPLFFRYFDNERIGGPIELTIYSSSGTCRVDATINLGYFFIDAEAKGWRYEFRAEEICTGYPILTILRKDVQKSAATLAFSAATSQYEAVDGSAGSIE